MTTTYDARPLTIHDTVTLATIVGWCKGTKRIVWLDDRNNPAYGTARSIGDERGNFAQENEDIRDCWLRITTVTGFEWFLPMADALERHSNGTMMEDSK